MIPESMFDGYLDFVIATSVLLLAFLPFVFALMRRHKYDGAVFVMNLVGFVIWPLWIVALAWSLIGEARDKKA